MKWRTEDSNILWRKAGAVSDNTAQILRVPGHVGIGEQPCGLFRQPPPGARQPENIEVLQTARYAIGPKEIANVDVVMNKYENGRILHGLA